MKKLLILCLALMPMPLFAATFHFAAPQSIRTGEETLVRVLFDAKNQKVNAVSGFVKVSGADASVSRIYDGGSALVLWLGRPVFNAAAGEISFSGLTPGGFSGDRELFSFVLKGGMQGRIALDAAGLEAYQNDASATPASLVIEPAAVYVRADSSTSTVAMADTFAPDPFIPVIASSKDVADGAPFVSFFASDKGTGIDRYEFAATLFGGPKDSDWQKAESPVFLAGKALYGTLYIRAVDKAGNERTEIIPGPRHYALTFAWVIIITLILCALLFIKRRLP